ncbi:MAG: Lrp/AsnC family transcriptional regulator [Candidatus Syntropharchaeia archaeon]
MIYIGKENVISAMIDELDKKILDSMIRGIGVGPKLTELAHKISEPRSTVNLRVDKLEERGIITKYKPKIDWKKLGYEFFGFVGIVCPKESIRELIEVLQSHPSVFEIWEISTGGFNVLAKCRFRAYDELRKLHEIVGKVQGVRDVDIWLLGSCYKEE